MFFVPRAHLAPRNIFQTEAMALLEKGDLFSDLTSSIKIPEESLADPSKLSKWALDQAITVFQSSTLVNDFLFVHGVTSAWSLSKICRHLDAKDAFDALFCYMNCLLVVYVRQGCPKLDLKRLEGDQTVSKMSWDDLVQKALKLPLDNLDEHVFKLVQVCKERAGECPDMDVICKRAALTAMSSNFTFTPAQSE